MIVNLFHHTLTLSIETLNEAISKFKLDFILCICVNDYV